MTTDKNKKQEVSKPKTVKKTKLVTDKRFLPGFDDNNCFCVLKEDNENIKIIRKGQPTKYKQAFVQQMLSFFAIRPFRVEVRETKTGSINYEVPNELPTFSKFALTIGVSRDTLNEWVKNRKEFRAAFDICKELQKDFLHQNALRENYSSQYAKFLAINNFNMKPDSLLDTSDDDSKVLRVNIINYGSLKEKENVAP